jgi:hypothetical protein
LKSVTLSYPERVNNFYKALLFSLKDREKNPHLHYISMAYIYWLSTCIKSTRRVFTPQSTGRWNSPKEQRDGSLEMFDKSRLAGLAALGLAAAMQAAPALSGTQTWNFNEYTQNFSSDNYGNTLSLTSSDGVSLTVSAWSDTDDLRDADKIETAALYWAKTNALGIINRDEINDTPNHSVDSITNDSDGEYDMLLMEFDTAVNLNAIDLNWARGGKGGNNSKTADVSILAWNGIGSSSLDNNTWSEVLGGGFDSAGNYKNVDLNYYAVNPGDVLSTQWLIGVYNPIFGSGGDAGDDGFKLGAIYTSTDDAPPPPPSGVPIPGSLPLVLLGLFALRNRIGKKTT